MTDQEIRERREKIRVIITEILMFISAVALVIFLTLIVMGYNFSFKRIGTEEEVIQRSGLVQVASRPSGAAILIDGNSTLLLRTNGSRTAAAGQHEISLAKEGYTGWKKEVKVTEGLMYRLNYPRLFLLEREEEKVVVTSATKTETEMSEKTEDSDVDGGSEANSAGVVDFSKVSYKSVSPDGTRLVYFVDGEIREMSLNGQKVNEKVLVSKTGIKSASECEWSGNGENMICRLDGEWGVVKMTGNNAEVTSLKDYINVEVKRMEFESEAGGRVLFVDKSGRLMELSLNTREKTRIGSDVVKEFDNDGERILYFTDKGEIKTIQVGEAEGVLIKQLEPGVEAQIRTVEYFQEVYFGIFTEGRLEILKAGAWPEEENEEGLEVEVAGEIEVEDGVLRKKAGGMAFAIEGEQKKAVYDIEAGEIKEFEIAGENGWVDEFLRYEVRDGKLLVVDYDGLNWVEIADGGVDEKFVKISGNNKYIYYFKNKELYRQKI